MSEKYGEKLRHPALSRSESEESETASDTIEMRNLPVDQKEEALLMFLENTKRSGGGRICDLKLDSKKRNAVVQFESANGTMIVFSNFAILLGRCSFLLWIGCQDKRIALQKLFVLFFILSF